MISPSEESQDRLEGVRQVAAGWLERGLRFFLTGRRGKVLSAFFLLITLGIVTSILVGNWDLLKDYRWQLRPHWLIYTVIFFTIDLLLAGWAWHLLAGRLANYSNFRRSMKITWYANLARRMPGPVWYIASRAVLYEEEGISKTTTSLLSALEIAFFLVSGVVTTLLTLPFWVLPGALAGRLQQMWFLLPLLPLSALMVHPRILEKVWQRVSKQEPAQRLRWRDTVAWLALYVLVWTVGALVLYTLINFFQPVPPGQLIAVVGMWTLSGSISLAGAITIHSIGLREISLALLLTQFVPAPVGVVIVIMVRLVWLIGELSSALVSLKL